MSAFDPKRTSTIELSLVCCWT